jgi:NitT/TauT family transport system ATP-binding protein
VSQILSLDNIDLYYGSRAILQGVSLSISRGEFVAIVGASGCGKSTLLKIIAGLLAPTNGSLTWQQQSPLSFVFQEPALLPWAKVIDNVALPLRLGGMTKAQARQAANQALQAVGLPDYEQAYPHQLSGGMKMRVSIARALVTRPQVLLLDEPFAALDDITRHKLNSELTQLSNQQAWTTVFVTHNIGEAVYLADRVLIMSNQPGQIAAAVPIAVSQPRSTNFRFAPEHNHYCRVISDHLALAMDSRIAP